MTNQFYRWYCGAGSYRAALSKVSDGLGRHFSLSSPTRMSTLDEACDEFENDRVIDAGVYFLRSLTGFDIHETRNGQFCAIGIFDRVDEVPVDAQIEPLSRFEIESALTPCDSVNWR